MSERWAGWLADSSFLLCFGAMPGGRKAFQSAFGGMVAVTPVVRAEVARIAGGSKGRDLQVSANQFSGTHHEVLLDAPFLQRDVPERDKALARIAVHALPDGPPQPLDLSPGSEAPGASKDQLHGGEAESIAVAMRDGAPLLMTDIDGRRYAEARAIPVESFTVALTRLGHRIKPQDLHGNWKRLRLSHYLGPETPSGQSWFRVPHEKRTMAAPPPAAPRAHDNN